MNYCFFIVFHKVRLNFPIAEHLGQNLLSVLEPYNSPGPAAIQYETEYFRSVFTTIDIAAISDTVARDIFMHKIVDWLMYGATGVSELTPNDIQLVIKPNPDKISTSQIVHAVWRMLIQNGRHCLPN